MDKQDGMQLSGLKVLFVTSGNVVWKMSPFTRQQADSLQEAGVTVEHFQVAEQGIKGYLRAVKRLRKYLAEHPVSLIHAHYSYLGWVADLARRKEKLIVSFLGSDIYAPLGSKNGIANRLLQRVTCWHARLRLDLSILMSERMHKIFGSSRHYVVLSDGINFKKFFPVERWQARKAIGWPEDKKIVLFAANPARPVKNFALAEKTVELLRDEQVLLKSFVDVPDELINYYYNAADVLLMTSRHEGSPNVVKEAMACNLPIISTDVGDVREVIAGTPGCSICPPDTEALAKALAVTLDKGVRTDGRERVCHLELSAVTQQMICLYESVLNS